MNLACAKNSNFVELAQRQINYTVTLRASSRLWALGRSACVGSLVQR